MKLTLQLAVGWLALTGALVWCQALGKVPPFPLPMLVALAFVVLCIGVCIGGLWGMFRNDHPPKLPPIEGRFRAGLVFAGGVLLAIAGGVAWEAVF